MLATDSPTHKKRSSFSQTAHALFSSASLPRPSSVFSRSSASSESTPTNPPFSRFDLLLAASDPPPPGPAFYAHRRRLWLNPGWESTTPKSRSHSGSRQKLESVLNQPGIVLYEDAAWKRIDRVWRNLSTGSRLSESLPMSLIIKIVHAAWVRDHTWPAGFEAPEPDDVAPPEDDTVSDLQLNTTQGVTEGAASPDSVAQ